MTPVVQPYRAAEERSAAHGYPPPPARYQPMTHAEWRWRTAARMGPVALGMGILCLLAWRDRDGTRGVIFLLAWISVLVVAVLARQRAGGAIEKTRRAVELLDAGRTNEAIALYEELVDRVRGEPALHSSIVMQLALARARQGLCDEALSMLHAVRAEGWLEAHVTYYVLAAGIAGAHANLGDLEDAARWQRVAHGRVPLAKRPHLAVLDAVLDARRGRYTELTQQLDAAWPALQAELARKPYPMKVLRLVRAFALARSDAGEARADEVRALVDAARAAAGETAQHRRTWPAFDEFLELHGIA